MKVNKLLCPVCKSEKVAVDFVKQSPFNYTELEGFSFKCHNCSVLFHEELQATCGSGVCVSCIMHENKPKMMNLLDSEQVRLLADRLLQIDKEKNYGMMTDLSFDKFLKK